MRDACNVVGKTKEDVREATRIAREATAAMAHGLRVDVDAAIVVTEASGLRLHLSFCSNTGYLGVRRVTNLPSGQPRPKPFEAQYKRDGRTV